MTVEEYKNKQGELYKDYKIKKYNLSKEFAYANNPYKIGDIIEDHVCRGCIESISLFYDMEKGLPVCLYHCTSLNKNNKPYKRNPKCEIHQSNVKRKIN